MPVVMKMLIDLIFLIHNITGHPNYRVFFLQETLTDDGMSLRRVIFKYIYIYI